jgi:hypothetical protein
MSNKLYYRDKQLWQLIRNIAIVFLLIGIVFFTMFAAFPEPDYKDFKQDTIVIQSLIYIEGSRYSGSYYVIVSEHGTKFNVSGDYDSATLIEHVQAGVKAEIKYYEGIIFRFRYIKVLIIEDEPLVTYVDRRRSTLLTAAITAGIIESIGAGLLCLGVWYKKSSHYTKEKTRELKERAQMKGKGTKNGL